MKGAGTAALAVAAAGVLAGCSNDKADDIIEVVEKKEIRVVFALGSGQVIGKYQTMKVAKDATSIPASQIDPDIVPKGYSIASTGNLSIDHVEGQDTVTVIVTLDPITKEITVKFYDMEKNAYLTETTTVWVDIDATTVDAEAVTAPDGYTIVGSQTSFITNGEVVINVTENPQTVIIQYYRKGLFGDVDVTTGKVTVPKSATTVEKSLLPSKPFKVGLFTYVIDDDNTYFNIVNGKIRVKVKITL